MDRLSLRPLKVLSFERRVSTLRLRWTAYLNVVALSCHIGVILGDVLQDHWLSVIDLNFDIELGQSLCADEVAVVELGVFLHFADAV